MKKSFFEIILLVLCSSVLIFYQFNSIPKNLAFDEVEFSRLALSLDKKPYTPYSTLATGHSTLYFYAILASFKIFGVTNFALRLPSAIFGVASVVVLYLILKKVFPKYVSFSIATFSFSFLLSLIFLTLRWYFNFARFAFEPPFLLFLELVSLYFLFCFFEKKETKYVILSALFTGLAFNSYTPGRIFFLLPLFFLIRKAIKNKASFFIFLIFFVLTIIPLSSYLIRNPDIRVEQQFFLKNQNITVAQKIEFFAQNIWSTSLMFHAKGDVNGRHNYPLKPALNPVIGSLFIVGFFIGLKNRAHFHNQFFLTYFFISLIPALLTYPWENPHMLRTFTVLPSVSYFIGYGILFILERFKHQKYMFTLLLFALVLSSFYEIRTYFLYQQKVFQQAFEVRGALPEVLNKTKLQLLMEE